jgi:hypothetical protein
MTTNIISCASRSFTMNSLCAVIDICLSLAKHAACQNWNSSDTGQNQVFAYAVLALSPESGPKANVSVSGRRTHRRS